MYVYMYIYIYKYINMYIYIYIYCKRFASPADPPQKIGFLGPRYRGTNLKSKDNKIDISLSLWDANGDKFVILASSGPRDLENLIPW